jgi:hypothetical protein
MNLNLLNSLGWIIPVVVIAILAITLGPFLIRLLRNSQMTSQVMKTGVDAMATIVRTWDTGVRINDNPQVGMLLQVQPPGGAPFQAEVRQTVSIVQIGMFQPGAQLQVKYDPANPSRVAIASVVSGGMAAPQMGAQMAPNMLSPQQVEQMLRQYDAANQQLIATGTQAIAKVLQFMPMGINVNGSNPAVNLMLEVHPDNGSAFTSQASGIVIAEASIYKYQPGQTITVRFNPSDLTKVAVEHSGT